MGWCATTSPEVSTKDGRTVRTDVKTRRPSPADTNIIDGVPADTNTIDGTSSTVRQAISRPPRLLQSRKWGRMTAIAISKDHEPHDPRDFLLFTFIPFCIRPPLSLEL